MSISAATIRTADTRARRGFTYRMDGPRDEWRSHADAVEAGQPWSDDCDGLASTVMDLLCRAGLPLGRGFRLLISTTGAILPDHMAGCVVDDHGRFWIVGDTNDPTYPAERCRYAVRQYNRLDERDAAGAIWREGAPFT